MKTLTPMSEVTHSLSRAARLDAGTVARSPRPLPPALRTPAFPDPAEGLPLPEVEARALPLADVLAARRSHRAFGAGPLPLATAGVALLAAGRADGLWSPDERQAGLGLDVFALADRVEGLERGLYRLNADSRVLHRTAVGLPPLDELLLQLELAAAPVVLVMAASALAAETRHGVHGYRLLLSRGASACYAAWLAAIGAGAVGCFFAGLLAPLRRLLSADGFDRVPLCALSVGVPEADDKDLRSAAPAAADGSIQRTGHAGRIPREPLTRPVTPVANE